MKLFQYALVGCLVVGLAGCGSPTTKGKAPASVSNKDKILGTWELVKAEAAEGIPPGTTVEYTKDGKVIVAVKADGKDMKIEGTYAVEGDSLKTTMKGPGGKEKTDTDTITKVTDTQLELKDKDGKKTEFKKK